VRPSDVQVVTDSKSSLRGRVTIISYDMVPRVLERVRERRFQVIIAVRPLRPLRVAAASVPGQS
jgi:hypothetical protein